MKIKAQKFFSTRVGQVIQVGIIYPTIFLLLIIGYALYYLAKPIRAVAYLLMFKPHSAWHEITVWAITYEFADL